MKFKLSFHLSLLRSAMTFLRTSQTRSTPPPPAESRCSGPWECSKSIASPQTPYLIYLFTTFIYLYTSIFPAKTWAFESGAKTTITATIPFRTDLRVFGYTSPNAIVEATGIRIYAKTYSSRDGYFLINSLPISAEASEICLTTIDAERRIGLPLCIPVPRQNEPSEIGPFLLSPTLSLTSPIIVENTSIAAIGKTIPDAQVLISYFEIPKSTLIAKFENPFIKKVEAADLPRVYINSDKRGNFSINLPTAKPLGYRLFAKAIFKESPTIKSQTLTYNVNSAAELWIKYLIPKLILCFLFLLAIFMILWWEYKTRKGRLFFAWFIENRLKPFGVRERLMLRRMWYNALEYLRSNQK